MLYKVAIPDEAVKFNYDHQRQFIMFQGTEVLQGKCKQGNYCKAVVIRTGEEIEHQGYLKRTSKLTQNFYGTYFHLPAKPTKLSK